MPRWTQKARQKQANRCRENKPWEHSTGPKTDEGKAVVKNNAIKHGDRAEEMIELRRLLFAQRKYVRRIMKEAQLQEP